MMKGPWKWVVIGVAVAALIALLLTLFNKAWWTRRIVRKWFVDINPANADKFRLSDLVYYYFYGHHQGYPNEQAYLRSMAPIGASAEELAYREALCTWCTEEAQHGIDPDCDQCNHA